MFFRQNSTINAEAAENLGLLYEEYMVRAKFNPNKLDFHYNFALSLV